MTTTTIDHTHDAAARSWVTSANGHPDFPLQNLPLGIFSDPRGGPRGGVAIGDGILDLRAVLGGGLFTGEGEAAAAEAAKSSLNGYFALPCSARLALRRQLFALLADDGKQDASARNVLQAALQPVEACRMHLPAVVGDYTDFFAGIHHAENGGVRMGRVPPLLPNYRHLPVAYHGRASSVVPSGATVVRPMGQRLQAGAAGPDFAPTAKLDVELELGMWIAQGNPLGQPIAIGEAHRHVAGFCLLNDLSARDIQAWEMAPLGPFLAKSFATVISPWVVTAEALAPFRQARMERGDGAPPLLPHLDDRNDACAGGLGIDLTLTLSSRRMRSAGLPAHLLASTSTSHLYWTPAQMVAHHTSGGCNLRPGDLFGSGTISGPTRDGFASLWEITDDGAAPLALPSGESRSYLEDGDRVVISGRARRAGFASVGLGVCAMEVASA